MIKCPKCGFEQPKDRFCANCGIIMENFSHNSDVISKPYKSSLFFLVGLVLIFFSGGVYWLYHRVPMPEPEEPTPQVKSFVPPIAQKNIPPKTQQVQSPLTTTPNTIVPVQNEPAAEATATSEPTAMTISFDLVNHDVMESLTRDGDGTLEVGRYSMSIVPDFKNKYESIATEKGFTELASESRNLTLDQPSLVFRGGKEPKSNEAIGFFVEVTPVRSTDRGTAYKTSIKRSLPEIMPTGEMKVTSQNYDENIVISIGSAAILAGLLPRKTLLEGEDELYKTNILKAFLEPTFQKGDDEFIIVIAPN